MIPTFVEEWLRSLAPDLEAEAIEALLDALSKAEAERLEKRREDEGCRQMVLRDTRSVSKIAGNTL